MLGEDFLEQVGGFRSEWWATSSRNGGRLQPGTSTLLPIPRTRCAPYYGACLGATQLQTSPCDGAAIAAEILRRYAHMAGSLSAGYRSHTCGQS
jgi:hypothetical protein